MGSKTYRRVDVETASQGRLIVMMFNGAISQAAEAQRRLMAGEGTAAHKHLIQAQEIIAELRSALNMDAGEVAHNLDRSYEYFHHLLVTANIKKTTDPIDECMKLMTSMRDTWQELFDGIEREESIEIPLAMNKHGASVMNLKG
jgi:flagellar protein FliS